MNRSLPHALSVHRPQVMVIDWAASDCVNKAPGRPECPAAWLYCSMFHCSVRRAAYRHSVEVRGRWMTTESDVGKNCGTVSTNAAMWAQGRTEGQIVFYVRFARCVHSGGTLHQNVPLRLLCLPSGQLFFSRSTLKVCTCRIMISSAHANIFRSHSSVKGSRTIAFFKGFRKKIPLHSFIQFHY